jgi:hypothetical protein
MPCIRCRKCDETIDVENILQQGCSCGYERRAMIEDIEVNRKNNQARVFANMPTKHQVQ